MDEENDQISDIGSVQDALAKILPRNTNYYVDALKNESSGSFSYKDTEISNFTLHHKTSSTGNCLTYSTSDGVSLQSEFYPENMPTLQNSLSQCTMAKHRHSYQCTQA